MKKKIETTEPVELTEGVTFRVEPSGLHFIVSRDQGSGFKPCGKDGFGAKRRTFTETNTLRR
jgi:hypothetical protein